MKHYCYIVRAGDHIKIGYTKNMDNRIAKMQTDNAWLLELLCKFVFDTEKIARGYEQDLHYKLRNFHVRGEWFRAEGSLKLLNDHGKFSENRLALMDRVEIEPSLAEA